MLVSRSELPRLRVWSDLDVKRPRRTRLVCNVPCLVGNCCGCGEKIVGLGFETLAGPRHVDHRIDDNVGNMHALGAQVSRHRLGENALRRFRWCEARKVRTTSLCGCIAGHNDGPLTGGYHGRCDTTRKVEQAHRVDLEVPIECRWVDFHERSPGAAHSI